MITRLTNYFNVIGTLLVVFSSIDVCAKDHWNKDDLLLQGDRAFMVKADYLEAFHYYEKSARNGNPYAKAALVTFYINDRDGQWHEDVAKKYALESQQFIKRQADKGDSGAQYLLAKWYQSGIFVDANMLEAFKLIRSAAEQGNAKAEFQLGYYYAYGKGVDQNLSKALYWYEKASSNGIVLADVNIGYLYEESRGKYRDIEKAVDYYRKAEKLGNNRARLYLGKVYLYGRGVKKDKEKAKTYFIQALEAGHYSAGYHLGKLFYSSKQYSQAIKYYHIAAKHKSPGAMINLGFMYQYGLGTQIDYNAAFTLYQTAANWNNPVAQYYLALLYLDGLGIESNREKAIELLTTSGLRGYKPAQDKLQSLSDVENGYDPQASGWYPMPPN